MARQTGQTTSQLKAAPKNAVFIWVSGATQYPRDLARKLGREDLKIVGPDWLTSDRWRGLELSDIILDHALTLKGREWEAYDHAKTRIRP